jgi:8-oxo-dGTP pyrophosphatase MutT (NUDIX family)
MVRAALPGVSEGVRIKPPQLVRKAAKSKLVAAGVAVKADDTGRVLMLQRALDPDDPASGKVEFPGGHLEKDETPWEGARREFQEEVGHVLPHGHLDDTHTSPNGVYQLFIYTVAREADVPLRMDRYLENPDDPDQDCPEVALWLDIDDLPGNPMLREECQGTPWDKLRDASYSVPSVPPVTKDAAGHPFRGNQYTGGLGGGGDADPSSVGNASLEGVLPNPVHSALGSSGFASVKEFQAVQSKAMDKIAADPKPTQADIDHNRRIIAESTRPGGELRGNSHDRHARVQFLLHQFGDGNTCCCYLCGRTLDKSTLTVDKIYTAPQGGSYRHANILPACCSCNETRNDTPLVTE